MFFLIILVALSEGLEVCIYKTPVTSKSLYGRIEEPVNVLERVAVRLQNYVDDFQEAAGKWLGNGSDLTLSDIYRDYNTNLWTASKYRFTEYPHVQVCLQNLITKSDGVWFEKNGKTTRVSLQSAMTFAKHSPTDNALIVGISILPKRLEILRSCTNGNYHFTGRCGAGKVSCYHETCVFTLYSNLGNLKNETCRIGAFNLTLNDDDHDCGFNASELTFGLWEWPRLWWMVTNDENLEEETVEALVPYPPSQRLGPSVTLYDALNPSLGLWNGPITVVKHGYVSGLTFHEFVKSGAAACDFIPEYQLLLNQYYLPYDAARKYVCEANETEILEYSSFTYMLDTKTQSQGRSKRSLNVLKHCTYGDHTSFGTRDDIKACITKRGLPDNSRAWKQGPAPAVKPGYNPFNYEFVQNPGEKHPEVFIDERGGVKKTLAKKPIIPPKPEIGLVKNPSFQKEITEILQRKDWYKDLKPVPGKTVHVTGQSPPNSDSHKLQSALKEADALIREQVSKHFSVPLKTSIDVTKEMINNVETTIKVKDAPLQPSVINTFVEEPKLTKITLDSAANAQWKEMHASYNQLIRDITHVKRQSPEPKNKRQLIEQLNKAMAVQREKMKSLESITHQISKMEKELLERNAQMLVEQEKSVKRVIENAPKRVSVAETLRKISVAETLRKISNYNNDLTRVDGAPQASYADSKLLRSQSMQYGRIVSAADGPKILFGPGGANGFSATPTRITKPFVPKQTSIHAPKTRTDVKPTEVLANVPSPIYGHSSSFDRNAPRSQSNPTRSINRQSILQMKTTNAYINQHATLCRRAIGRCRSKNPFRRTSPITGELPIARLTNNGITEGSMIGIGMVSMHLDGVARSNVERAMKQLDEHPSKVMEALIATMEVYTQIGGAMMGLGMMTANPFIMASGLVSTISGAVGSAFISLWNINAYKSVKPDAFTSTLLKYHEEIQTIESGMRACIIPGDLKTVKVAYRHKDYGALHFSKSAGDQNKPLAMDVIPSVLKYMAHPLLAFGATLTVICPFGVLRMFEGNLHYHVINQRQRMDSENGDPIIEYDIDLASLLEVHANATFTCGNEIGLTISPYTPKEVSILKRVDVSEPLHTISLPSNVCDMWPWKKFYVYAHGGCDLEPNNVAYSFYTCSSLLNNAVYDEPNKRWVAMDPFPGMNRDRKVFTFSIFDFKDLYISPNSNPAHALFCGGGKEIGLCVWPEQLRSEDTSPCSNGDRRRHYYVLLTPRTTEYRGLEAFNSLQVTCNIGSTLIVSGVDFGKEQRSSKFMTNSYNVYLKNRSAVALIYCQHNDVAAIKSDTIMLQAVRPPKLPGYKLYNNAAGIAQEMIALLEDVLPLTSRICHPLYYRQHPNYGFLEKITEPQLLYTQSNMNYNVFDSTRYHSDISSEGARYDLSWLHHEYPQLQTILTARQKAITYLSFAGYITPCNVFNGHVKLSTDVMKKILLPFTEYSGLGFRGVSPDGTCNLALDLKTMSLTYRCLPGAFAISDFAQKDHMCVGLLTSRMSCQSTKESIYTSTNYINPNNTNCPNITESGTPVYRKNLMSSCLPCFRSYAATYEVEANNKCFYKGATYVRPLSFGPVTFKPPPYYKDDFENPGDVLVSGELLAKLEAVKQKYEEAQSLNSEPIVAGINSMVEALSPEARKVVHVNLSPGSLIDLEEARSQRAEKISQELSILLKQIVNDATDYQSLGLLNEKQKIIEKSCCLLNTENQTVVPMYEAAYYCLNYEDYFLDTEDGEVIQLNENDTVLVELLNVTIEAYDQYKNVMVCVPALTVFAANEEESEERGAELVNHLITSAIADYMNLFNFNETLKMLYRATNEEEWAGDITEEILTKVLPYVNNSNIESSAVHSIVPEKRTDGYADALILDPVHEQKENNDAHISVYVLSGIMCACVIVLIVFLIMTKRKRKYRPIYTGKLPINNSLIS
ncbi:hypothetical protein [Ranid herpesvirus 3]|uniref:Poxvirus B22R protein C-terminal domain-containing protein n=1 Tax=Ranid herpesvirus 3 TaxID=1987509 RepID=A0A1X9T559_9VIRU|nr:hypothetical protein [Ranid herpesvirus 3]ARR28838.1 hypothetical protein [Ranid herpesvirus 3]